MVLNSDVKERKKAPARPPPPIHVNSQKKIPHSYIPSELSNDQTNVQSWEDARELFSVINSMCKSLMLRVTVNYVCQVYYFLTRKYFSIFGTGNLTRSSEIICAPPPTVFTIRHLAETGLDMCYSGKI